MSPHRNRLGRWLSDALIVCEAGHRAQGETVFALRSALAAEFLRVKVGVYARWPFLGYILLRRIAGRHFSDFRHEWAPHTVWGARGVRANRKGASMVVFQPTGIGTRAAAMAAAVEAGQTAYARALATGAQPPDAVTRAVEVAAAILIRHGRHVAAQDVYRASVAIPHPSIQPADWSWLRKALTSAARGDNTW